MYCRINGNTVEITDISGTVHETIEPIENDKQNIISDYGGTGKFYIGISEWLGY